MKEFLTYFLVVHAGLALLFLGIDFFTNFWDMTLPLRRVAEVYGYKAPAALQQFFPMACLMATLMVLSSMSRQNEVLALYSSGIGQLRIASTLIAAVAVLSTVAFIFFDSTVPLLNLRKNRVMEGKDPNAEEIAIPSQLGFWYRSGNYIYDIGRYRADTGTMEDVNVYAVTPGFELTQRIHAREARFENGDWTLSNGFQIGYPLETRFPLFGEFAARRGIIREKPADFKSVGYVSEDTMRLRDLRTVIAINRSSGLDTTGWRITYHERVATVFTPLVLVLLGIPWGLKPLRTQSLSGSIAFCFFIVFGYLLIFRMSMSIGRGGHVPPVVAAWVPNVLFLSLSGMTLTKRAT